LLHLNLSNNPAAWEEDYRQRLVGALPALQDLDAVDVTPAELEAYGFEVEEEEEVPAAGGIVAGGGAPPPLTFGLDGGLAALGGGGGGGGSDLTAVDEDGAAPEEDGGGAAAAGSVDFAEGGEVDFASRYARAAIDVPATLDSMTDGIMETCARFDIRLLFAAHLPHFWGQFF